MTQKLLVPLRGGDRIEEVLPYVQGIAQPGMTVVFLVHFGINRFSDLAAQLLTIDSGLPANFNADAGSPAEGADRLSSVERRIQRAADKLRRRGVAIQFKFYSGSWRRQMRSCLEDDPHRWVIMRPVRNRVQRWLHAVAAALKIAGPLAPAPVVLLDPNCVARR